MAFSRLFTRVLKDRIVAIAVTKSVELSHMPGRDRVGLAARLLDHKTSQPSADTLILDLHPGDAVAFAHLVLGLAKERGWKADVGEPYDRPGHPSALN